MNTLVTGRAGFISYFLKICPILLKTITSVCLILSIFILLACAGFNYKMLLVDSPQEYRENASILTTDLLLKGENPFSLKNQPAYTNTHGILYNLAVFPFAKILGSTYTVHRAISAFFILASCLLFYYFLRRQKIAVYSAVIACALLYIQLVTGGFDITSRPDSLGFFLFLLSFIIPVISNYSKTGLVLSVILSVLAFLAKPYFIVGIAYFVIYLFIFKSKIKGFVYFVFSVIFLIIAYVIISNIFEFYFINTVYLQYYQVTKDYNHLFQQMKVYWEWNFSSILILFIPAVIFLKRLYQKFIINRNNFKISNYIDISSCDSPLILVTVDFAFVALIISAGLVIFKMGFHTGQYMTYFYHLITPFLLIVTFTQLTKQKRIINRVIFMTLITVNLIYFIYTTILHLPGIPDEKETWQYIEKLISEHQNVYNSPETAHILSKLNRPVYDNGHSKYFSLRPRDVQDYALVKKGYDHNNEFISGIHKQIRQKKFDMVIITAYLLPYFTMDVLESSYKLQEGIPIRMYKQIYYDEIWIPK